MRELYRVFARGIRAFGTAVVLLETATYTFSFLFSGLAKKDIFNVLEGQETTLGITSLGVLISLNVLMPLLINAVKQMNAGLAEKLRTKIRYNVKSALMGHVLERAFDDCHTEGDIVNYYRNECEDIVSYFMEFYNRLPGIALSLSILIVMFFIHPVFALVSILPTAMTVILVKALSRRIFAYRMSARDRNREVTGFLNTFFENVEYFYMIDQKDRIIELYAEKCRKRSGSEIKDRILDRLVGVASANSSNLALGIILLIALPFMASGEFSVGELVMFEYYYAFLAGLPDAISGLAKRRKQTGVSMERLGFLLEEGKRCPGTVSEQGGLRISLEMDGEEKSVQAKDGDVIVIRDKDGGRLLRELFLLCKSSGKAWNCRYVPREPVLLDESIKANICMDGEYSKEKMDMVLERADLWEDIEAFEEGILKQAGKRGENLSGGQRKRIGIARALYSDGDILFLDGLTDRVDRRTGEKLIRGVLGRFEGIVVMVED
ncbi:ABC transporter ATP-binding protein [uncultured Acetatifactor sp.]|uniref:ABC transporter transmembrane domain-containing protein n=1 Tax=uncultured Acetatifactor sp. TaxID=1671927 RepID=UPI0026137824|nr:ABC transporter ATP-binding protein [uncultured Acetatifactor sp.]